MWNGQSQSHFAEVEPIAQLAYQSGLAHVRPGGSPETTPAQVEAGERKLYANNTTTQLDSIGTPIYLSTSPPLNYIANLIIAVNIQSCAPSNVSKGLRAVDM